MTTPSTILIVEHDEGTIATYARMLRIEGFTVQTATSAEDGLREVASGPAAILVDFRMPEMDGLEFLRRLRGRTDARDVPVAIVTGDYLLDPTVLAELRTLGAEVTFKPLWIEDLCALVRALLAQTGTPGGEK